MQLERVYGIKLSTLYPLYAKKVEAKGRTRAELDAVTAWLTGYGEKQLQNLLASDTDLRDFFAGATLNPKAALIKGVVCGVRVEDIDDPLMQKIRYLDKLVDELAKGKTLEKILRS